MDESTERQAVPPGRCEVGDVDSSVPASLLLTPGEQAAGMHLRLCTVTVSGSVSMVHTQEGDFVTVFPYFPRSADVTA